MLKKQRRTRESNDQEEDVFICPANVMRSSFKASYFIVGVPFDNKLTKWNRFMNAVQIVRISTIIMIAAHYNYVHSKMKVIEYVTEFTFDACGPIEFVYLAYSLTKLNRVIENYCRRLNMTLGDSSQLVKTIRKCNLLCFTSTISGFTLFYSYGLVVVNVPDNWVIKHTIPWQSSLSHTTQSIIAYIFLIHEYAIKNYIPLSIGLYLTYYMLLIAIKRRVLTHICNSTTCERVLAQLQELDAFHNSFESTLSILPLNWLSYNIGPGLCYLLAVLNPVEESRLSGQKIIFTVFTCWNLISVLLTLHYISRLQEDLDAAVDSYRWRMDSGIHSISQWQMIQRVDSVMKRKVTVWHTLPIERVLILSYLGSALTFSVFLSQMSL